MSRALSTLSVSLRNNRGLRSGDAFRRGQAVTSEKAPISRQPEAGTGGRRAYHERSPYNAAHDLPYATAAGVDRHGAA